MGKTPSGKAGRKTMTGIRPLPSLPDILLIDRPTHEDDRGFFREYFRLGDLESVVSRPIRFVQANHSFSKQNVLRGVHVATYDKLMYVPNGEVDIVVVDVRPSSATFGNHAVLTVGDANRLCIFLPAGFGNSYLVRSATANYLYFVTEYYDPAKEQTIRWDDPDLAIPWKNRSPIISQRDQDGKTVRELFPERFSSNANLTITP